MNPDAPAVDAVPDPPHALLTELEARTWGQELGRQLPRGAVVALHGDLGTGKTTLVRAICEGLGVLDLARVTSPTYSLVHEYESPAGSVVHADLYRVRSAIELEQLGWDEMLGNARATLIEWPGVANDYLASSRYELFLAHVAHDPSRRAVRIERLS